MADQAPQSNRTAEVTLVEAFVYKLGNRLGGRREVLATPAVELLGYTDMEMEQREAEMERERARIWFNFVVSMITQPAMGKEDSKMTQARQDFIETFQPKPTGPVQTNFDWDPELMKQLSLTLKGG